MANIQEDPQNKPPAEGEGEPREDERNVQGTEADEEIEEIRGLDEDEDTEPRR